jgi:hypothetical protein
MPPSIKTVPPHAEPRPVEGEPRVFVSWSVEASHKDHLGIVLSYDADSPRSLEMAQARAEGWASELGVGTIYVEALA